MHKEYDNYNVLIDRLVLSEIQAGNHSFACLAHTLPGIYPVDTAASITRLKESNIISTQVHDIIKGSQGDSSTKVAASHYLGAGIELPVPHPLNYDWRFSEAAVHYLIKQCNLYSAREDEIVFLGAPSVVTGLYGQNYTRKGYLFDRNEVVISHIQTTYPTVDIVHCDILFDPVPDIKAAIVVVDPPWYFEHFDSFMWVASQVCEPHGHALLSLPAIGTRPGIKEERKHIFEWSKYLGFELLKLEVGVLRYVSPPFELNALRSKQLDKIPIDWRRSDLAIFKKTNIGVVDRPIARRESNKWNTRMLDKICWQLKEQSLIGFQDPSLIQIIPGSILGSVSRREKIRDKVDVWTTGNRIFSCKDTETLGYIIQAIEKGESVHKYIDNYLGVKLDRFKLRLVSNTAMKVEEITRIERSEIDEYFGKIKQ